MIFFSLALIKERDYQNARAKMNELLVQVYEKYSFLKTSGILGEKELEYYNRVSSNMSDSDATLALHQMSGFLSRYYGKKVIILLSGVTNYNAMVGPKGKDLDEKVGYYGEKIFIAVISAI